MLLTVAPPLTCKGVVNRATGGKATASTEISESYGAAVAFAGKKSRNWGLNKIDCHHFLTFETKFKKKKVLKKNEQRNLKKKENLGNPGLKSR